MYTIRFHLSKGEHFMHYQVRELKGKSSQGDVVGYINPETHSLIMRGCKLHIMENLSNKIFTGEQKKKKPCAWVICDSFEVVKNQLPTTDTEIAYNPRKNPNWLVDGFEMNFAEFDIITTNNSKLFV